MNHRNKILIATVCCTFSFNASAQDIDAATKKFHDFFAPFLGGDWNYHTHMTDAQGDTVYEGTDIRRYRPGVRGRFVIENVFAESDTGELTHIGIQMIGLDADTGNIHISAFWPWQATMLGDVVATIGKQADGSNGISGIARAVGQTFPELRFNCSYLDNDELHCRTITTTEDGKSFQSNVETFTRRNH